MNFYLVSNGHPDGPYTVEQLAKKNIKPDTLVWNESMTDWTRASEIPELRFIFTCPPPATPPAVPSQEIHNNVCPETYLVFAILATILCCLPLGVVGIVKASQVESLFNMGKYDEALAASNSAKNWTIAAAITGIVVIIIYLAIGSVIGSAFSSAMRYY